MGLDDSRWEMPLLLIVVFSALGGFGIISLRFNTFDWTVGEQMRLVVPLGLAVAYMLSQRDMGQMSNVETASFMIPVISVFLYEGSPEFRDMATNMEPYFGTVIVAMVGFAYYALTNENL